MNTTTHVATLITPPLANGPHSFTAVYSGDDSFYSSTATATATVSTAAYSVTISGAANATEGDTASPYELTLPTQAGGYPIANWLINWGDGSSDLLTTTSPATTTHVFGAPGTLAIAAIAVNSQGVGYSANLVTVTVTAAAPHDVSLSVDSASYSGADTMDGGSAAPDELHVTFVGPAKQESYNADINWGDGSPHTTFTLDPGQTTFDYPLPQYPRTGTFGITVTVTDAEHLSAYNTPAYDVTYSNVQPSPPVLNLDQLIMPLGGGTSIGGSFGDMQWNPAHVVIVDWGDPSLGSADTTTLDLSSAEATFQASTPDYEAPGTYTITVTVSGVDGSASQQIQLIVAGSATGITASPANIAYGQSVTLAATVTSTPACAGTPTGTVDFYDESAGIDLGTADLNGGAATLSIGSLAVGWSVGVCDGGNRGARRQLAVDGGKQCHHGSQESRAG